MIVTLHMPEWIGEQAFRAHLNRHPIETKFELLTSDTFWQEVRIELPAALLSEGNNFMSLAFDRLVTSPSSPRLKAAALLQSIQIVPNASANQ